MLKGIIFDMDGTITLTEQLHHKAFSAVFKEFGIKDFTFEDEIRRFAGSGSANIFTTVLKEKGMKFSDKLINRCVKKKRKLYTKIIQESRIPLVNGIYSFLKKTEKKDLKRIIATGNGDLKVVRLILRKIKLLNFFPKIISITEVKRGKPFPDVFLEALKRIGLEKNECVVIEDAINGVTAAKKAGIRCIGLTTTTAAKALKKAGAFATVENYYQITDKILYEK